MSKHYKNMKLDALPSEFHNAAKDARRYGDGDRDSGYAEGMTAAAMMLAKYIADHEGEQQTMNVEKFDEIIDNHKWLMRHCDLLKERFDKLPPWALIRQHRILAEWEIALNRGEQVSVALGILLERMADDE